MSRTPMPLVIEDVAQFADVLRANWPETPPGHLRTMNLVARAAGYRSWQVLKATAPTPHAISDEEMRRVGLALRVFDTEGRMTRWPKGYMVQRLCLAAFWSRIPSQRNLSERQINAILKAKEVFGDHVLLRRSLADHGLVRRATDGSVYRRIERRPSAAERLVIRTLSERWNARTLHDEEMRA